MAGNPIANLLGKVDANGALLVAISGAAGPVDSLSFSGGSSINGATTNTLKLRATGSTDILTLTSTAVTSTVPVVGPAGSSTLPTFGIGAADTGWYSTGTGEIGLALGGGQWLRIVQGQLRLLANDLAFGGSSDLLLSRGAANTLDQKNGTNAQTYRYFGYVSGSRTTFESIASVTTAVTLSGASTSTGNVIPAGATVVDVATSTTTAITGASGYTVGDGSDADRYGDITGTALGTNSGSTNYTADPRWWTNAARAIVLTAKTSNFTGGVVQVTVFYRSATGS